MTSHELIRVLVIDDSAFSRQAITRMLATSPLVEVVGVARDGEEALRKTFELEPDLITLDLEMPKMDGFTFLRIVMSKRPTLSSSRWFPPGATRIVPGVGISPPFASAARRGVRRSRRSANPHVNPSGMCWATRNEHGGASENAPKICISAAGPPVEDPITTTGGVCVSATFV